MDTLRELLLVVNTDATNGDSSVDVKIVSRVETVGSGGTETRVDYAESNREQSIRQFLTIFTLSTTAGVNTDGLAAYTLSVTPAS